MFFDHNGILLEISRMYKGGCGGGEGVVGKWRQVYLNTNKKMIKKIECIKTSQNSANKKTINFL